MPVVVGCAAAGLVVAIHLAVLAQEPDPAAPAAAEGAPTMAPTAVATPEVVDSPTRRPTRPAAPTSTMTVAPTGTESATAIAPTPTEKATARPRATATRLVPPKTSIPPSLPLPPPAGAGNDTLFMLAGGALALIAAWSGARIASARERTERRQARRTLATAMLQELRRIDAVLRRVVGLDNPSLPALDHPIIEASLRDLTLFQTSTAARIAQFHGALRSIQHEIGDYRDNPLRWAGRLAEFNQLMKARAAAACRAVPELMKALEREGGTPPPQLGEPSAVAQTSSEALPPPPFGAGEGDDWTL